MQQELRNAASLCISWNEIQGKNHSQVSLDSESSMSSRHMVVCNGMTSRVAMPNYTHADQDSKGICKQVCKNW